MRALLSLFALTALAGAGRGQVLLYEWAGPSTDSYYGGAVAGLGDIDGDGVPELMVGAPGHAFVWIAQWAKGFVEVRSGRTGVTLYRMLGAANNPLTKLHAGTVVGPAGDVDADGVPDFLYGSDGYLAASFTVRSGASGGVLYHKNGSYPLTTGLGSAVLGGVDLDGDGFDDFAATDPGGGASGSGLLRAYKGKNGKLLYELPAPAGTCSLGSSVDTLGDVDGDGRHDLIVGSIEDSPCGPGEVLALSGADGSVLYTVTGTGRFGASVAALGDVDGDGHDDFVVGAYWAASNEGRAYVYSGLDGAFLRELRGSHAGALFGSQVAGPGDIDGDGVPDVAVSAPLDDERGTEAGRVTVFSGADGSVLRVFYGKGAYDRLGAVSGAGDVDGGGLPDLILGARFGGALDEGRAYVYSSERSPGTYCSATTNSQGCVPTAWADGVASLTASTLELSAHSVINEQNGFLFWGLQPASVPFFGGLRCVGRTRGRRPAASGGNAQATFGADCSGSFRTPLTGAYLTGQGLAPGQTVYAQYWYVDPGTPQAVGLTDALQLSIVP